MSVCVETFEESVAAFHGRDPGVPRTIAVWVCVPTDAAVVLGSTQADEVVDRTAAAAEGMAVVRRRSGGGAVLVDGASVWIDLVVPAGDPNWHDDIARAAAWAGTCWRDALAALWPALAGVMRVHTGPMVHTPWSRLVCFDGTGPGEVMVGERKLVGLSQRRTRHAARFQAMCTARPDQDRLVRVLARPRPDPGVLAEPAALALGGEPVAVAARRLGERLAAIVAG